MTEKFYLNNMDNPYNKPIEYWKNTGYFGSYDELNKK